MLTSGAPVPLSYRRVRRADLDGAFADLELDPDQVEHFLDPLDRILAAVRGGLAHSLYRIEADGRPVGFYVVHPDRRDSSRWWLGWFALDRREQGRGYGRRVLARVMRQLRMTAGCHSVRLYVAPDNATAMRLYRGHGFVVLDLHETDDLVMEATLAEGPGLARSLTLVLRVALPKRARRKGRVRLHSGPHPAAVIGVERGPPPGPAISAAA